MGTLAGQAEWMSNVGECLTYFAHGLNARLGVLERAAEAPVEELKKLFGREFDCNEAIHGKRFLGFLRIFLRAEKSNLVGVGKWTG
jgi:hypothetical protein